MIENNNTKENKIWVSVITILPVVILMNAGRELTDDNDMRILYSGIFGGIGGLIGFVAFFLTKDKKRVVKIFTSGFVMIFCTLTLYFLSSNQTDKEILQQKWRTQKIGKIEFDNPEKLKLRINEIPESIRWFYSKLNIYSDENNDRITSFLQSEILIDTLSVQDIYSSTLERMLKKIDVNIEEIDLYVFTVDEEEVSSMFSFELNGNKVNGYGFMYLNGKTLESIWLMPLKKGFSKDYIIEFESGIIVDY